MSWLPTFMKDLTTTNYGMWNAPDPGLHADGSVTPGEGGVDLSVPIGTPVYAIADGPIMASGYWNDNAHGVITQRVTVPGAGQQDLYYQHIQLAPNMTPGTNLTRGELIGTIGPFNEIEMGFNAAWGGVWGKNHPGPWVKDPRPWLTAILNGSGAGTTPVTTAPAATFNPLDPINSGFAMIQPTLKQWGEYVAIFLIALVLIIVGFVLLNRDAVTSAAKLAGKAAML